ncbi:hypothetical protein ACFDDA_00145 [Escherichia coli]
MDCHKGIAHQRYRYSSGFRKQFTCAPVLMTVVTRCTLLILSQFMRRKAIKKPLVLCCLLRK